MNIYMQPKKDKMKFWKKILNFCKNLLNFKKHHNYINKTKTKNNNVMMQQLGGFDAGPGGGIVSGKWTNKRTGEVINVRDSLIDGDSMVVITDRGHIDMADFSNNYIQVSDEVYNTTGQVVSTSKPDKSEFIVPQVPQQQMYDLDKPFNLKTEVKADVQSLQDVPSIQQVQRSTVEVETTSESKSHELISKIFAKNNSKPNIKLDIDWADFPANELKMLVNFLDVSKEDISTYISKKYDMQQLFVESLCDFLEQHDL